MLSTSTFSPLPPEAAAANLGTAVLWREGLPLAVSATCPAPPLCPATASLRHRSAVNQGTNRKTTLPDYATFAWFRPLGFMRHPATHSAGPKVSVMGTKVNVVALSDQLF